MYEVYSEDGQLIGSIALSERQLNLLETGKVTVLYHTPQLLRALLGEQNGSFTLDKKDGRITAADIQALKQYIALQADIQRAREH